MTVKQKTEIFRSSVDFLALGVILALSLFGLYYFRHQLLSQLVITVLMGVSYVFWGILHHLHADDLHPRIIFEYISLAALFVFILVVFLFRV